MKIPAIFATSLLAGSALAGLPDPKIAGRKVTFFKLSNEDKASYKNVTGSQGVVTYGDMVLTDDQNKTIFGEKDDGPGSRSFKKPARIWDQYPKNGYFRIAVKVDRDSFQRLGRNQLYYFDQDYPEAVKDFKAKTGIELGFHSDYTASDNPNRGDPDWDHAHWMHLTAASAMGLRGCSSWMGRLGNWRDRSLGFGNGQQDISLGAGCHYKNTIMHEIIHALGWTHEQNRADRDQAVSINWNKISQPMWSQFKLAKGAETSGTPYDPQSVMHYHDQSFGNQRGAKTMISKTNIPVITSPQTYDRKGEFQRRGLSDYDAYEINVQYDLTKHCKSEGMVWALWDSAKGEPKRGARVDGSSGCIASKTTRFAGCVFADANICKRGHSCVDTAKSPGYICKRDIIDPCVKDSNLCGANGRCASEKNTGDNPMPFTCTCSGDWFGTFCENKIECVGEQEMMFDENMQMTKLCGPFDYGFSRGDNIDLSGRKTIRGITQKAFSVRKWGGAKQLNMERCDINKVHRAAFVGLSGVKKMNLQYNKLTTLPSGLFNGNGNLKNLNLQYNKLTGRLASGVVSSSIKHLFLNDNKDLEFTESTFAKLRNAKKIYLYNTKSSSNSIQRLCRSLVRNRKVASGGCCYGTTRDAFGREIKQCI